nr:methylase [Enterococcus sp.]
AENTAKVHCVIIGFSNVEISDKLIYNANSKPQLVKNINTYLLNSKNVFVESKSKPICNVPAMMSGNRPADGGNLILDQEEKDQLIKEDPSAKKYIKRYMMGREFIHNIPRYCLWLVGITPKELRDHPLIFAHVKKCKEDRLKGAADRKKLANTPWLFREQLNPKAAIALPVVSSEKREYIPIDFINTDVIAGNKLFLIPDGNHFMFGILNSSLHNDWMRTVAGRLEMRYSYSKNIVYNNFPWPNTNEKQKEKITKTAQEILNARELYPDSSLADLYDPFTMPPELRKAHEDNDKAVLKAYGLKPSATEPEIVQHLFKLYEKLTQK